MSPSRGTPMHFPDWVPNFAPSGLADWLIFAICIYEAYHTRQERRQRTEHPVITAPARRLRYWPWIVLAILATVLAWSPVYLLRNTPASAPSVEASLKATVHHPDVNRQANDLKARLRDANATIAQFQSKLEQSQTKLAAIGQELQTANQKNTAIEQQRHNFCQSGLMKRYYDQAVLLGRAGKELQPMIGETSVTAACLKAIEDAKDRFSAQFDATMVVRKQVIEALSLPNEGGCVDLPTEPLYEMFH